MSYTIVTNHFVMNDIKKSKYFKRNLGLASTVEMNGDRAFNQKDQFSFWYNTNYKTTIYMQGNIGTIIFYVDMYIKDNVLAVYKNNTEKIVQHNPSIINEKGIEFFLGSIIKEIEEEQKEKDKDREEELKKPIEKPIGDFNKLKINPGAVNYEDIKSYLDQKNKDRFNS